MTDDFMEVTEGDRYREYIMDEFPISALAAIHQPKIKDRFVGMSLVYASSLSKISVKHLSPDFRFPLRVYYEFS